MKCYGCQQNLEPSAFHKDASASRGYSGKCKECKKKFVRTPEQLDRMRLIGKQHYIDNRDKHRATMSEWRVNNKDKMLGYWHNYKAKLRANGPVDKDITRLKVYERDQGICKICNKPCLYEESSIDHIRPVSKGGTHTWSNVQNTHRICNIKKGAS